MSKIVVSPGHTAEYKGAEKNGYVEYDICRSIADHLLGLPDVEVIDTNLSERIKIINDIKPEVAVEIHTGNSNMYNHFGTKAFFMIYDRASQQLAECLAGSVSTTLGNRGLRFILAGIKRSRRR